MVWIKSLHSPYCWFSPRWRMVLLCLGMALVRSSMGEERQETQVDADWVPNVGRTPPPRCWVFVHLQKAGGSTIKTILNDRWKPNVRIYDTRAWTKGEDFTRAVAYKLLEDNEFRFAVGGYTEGLRKEVGRACKWFVVFRHPVSRLVSAYFYCKVIPIDPLCASMVLNAQKASLEEFAKHWGNFGLRQFVLSLVSADEVNEVSEGIGVKQLPGWYRLKQYLDHRGSKSGGDENTVMYEMLYDVQNLLHNQTDAVGILEDFNTTLRLFDRSLEVPHFSWTTSFGRAGVRNKDKRFAKMEELALQEARTSAEVKRYISLDLLLYEHAVDVFHEQAERYGLR